MNNSAGGVSGRTVDKPTREDAKQHRQEQKAAAKAAKIESAKIKKQHDIDDKERKQKDKDDRKRDKKHHHKNNYENRVYIPSTTTRSTRPIKTYCECMDGKRVDSRKADKKCKKHGGIKRCD